MYDHCRSNIRGKVNIKNYGNILVSKNKNCNLQALNEVFMFILIQTTE